MPELGPPRKLTWPEPSVASGALGGSGATADSLTQFQEWAAELRDSDDRNLGRLGLRPAEEIKKLSENPKVHGFILDRASVEQLNGFLYDSGVRSVNVADVAFDLGTSETEQ